MYDKERGLYIAHVNGLREAPEHQLERKNANGNR